MAAVTGATDGAGAQDVSLNYERLSSVEEPLASEIGDVTFVLTGLMDTRFTPDTEDADAAGTDVTGNFEVTALAQLPNRWRVGLTYFGQYEGGQLSAADQIARAESDGTYTDNAALSVGGVWGTVLAGNVSGIVREHTRRLRGAGNGALALDGFLGVLEDRSGGYLGRFGPWILGSAVDESGHFDLGAIFQRPRGNKDYRLTLRAAEGVFIPADRSGRFDTRGAAVVAEFIYGSRSVDVGVGYEGFSSNGADADRWYVSSGVRKKVGVVSLSVEGHFGRIEGEDELSAALGAQYDVARGLSVNLGVNHAEARATLGGAMLFDVSDTKAVLSLRYSF